MLPKDDDEEYDEEYYVTRAKVALGWGDLFGLGYDATRAEAAKFPGADGPPTDKEALSRLLRLCVSNGVEAWAVVPLCLLACESDDRELRVVGLAALEAIAARGEVLPELKRVKNVLRAAMADPDPAVNAAAAKAGRHIQ